MVETDKEALLDFVRETHRLACETDVVERAKAGRKVSEKTAADYHRVAVSRIDFKNPRASKLLDGVTRQSFDHHRAALRHALSKMFSKHRSLSDKAQRDGDLQKAFAYAKSVRVLLELYKTVSNTPKPTLKTPRKSKRKTLPADPGWKERAWSAATQAMKPAVACALVGARPNEIERGVTIEILEDEERKEFVRVTIQGAKVTGQTGQPERSLVLSTDTFEGRCLKQVVGQGIPGRALETVVKRKAKRISLDWSQRIRPAVGGSVSSYSLRHLFAANLKASGLDEVSIAKALGHLSVKSQQRYGSKQQGSRGGVGLVEVDAAREVKNAAVIDDFDPSPSP